MRIVGVAATSATAGSVATVAIDPPPPTEAVADASVAGVVSFVPTLDLEGVCNGLGVDKDGVVTLGLLLLLLLLLLLVVAVALASAKIEHCGGVGGTNFNKSIITLVNDARFVVVVVAFLLFLLLSVLLLLLLIRNNNNFGCN